MDKETQSESSKTSTILPVPAGMDQPIEKAKHVPTTSQGDTDAKGTDTSIAITSELHPKFADEVHKYIREYIRNADQKAAFIFTASTALVAYLKNNGALSQWIKSPLNWNCVSLLAFISTAGLTICAGTSLFVVFPRRRPGSKRGLIFFDAIAEHESGRDYVEDILQHSPNDLLKAKLSHCFDLAKVCRAKYDLLYVAFWALAIGIGATILYLIFFVKNPG